MGPVALVQSYLVGSCVTTVYLIQAAGLIQWQMEHMVRILGSITFQCDTTSLGLLDSRLTQVSIKPSAEAVFLVPAALAMTNQDQLVSGHP